MKTINKLFLFLGLTLAVMSCEDAYKIDQPGRLPAEEAFQTVGDLDLGLLGAYRLLDLTPEIAFSATFTDEISIGFDNGGQGLSLYRYQLNAGSVAASNFWTRNYSVINAANRIIEASEFIDVEEDPNVEDGPTKSDVLAQARAIRAFAHYELLRYFSPDIRNPSSLGVFKVDFVPQLNDVYFRDTTGEVLELIQEDLNFAQANLVDESNIYFFSVDAIKAFKARIAADLADYPTVLSLTDELLTKYPLSEPNEYIQMFLADPQVDGEAIMKFNRTVGDRFDGQGATGSVNAGGWVGAIFAFVDSTINGSPYYEMSRNIFNDLDPNGARYQVLVEPTSVIDDDPQVGDNATDDVLVIGKYPGGQQPLLNDLMVFRASEMLLLRAEALAYTGSLNGSSSSAAALLKEIRDIRGVNGGNNPLPSYSNLREALADILFERQLELAYEGHRYKDLKRLGEDANVGISRADVDCVDQGGFCELNASDFRMVSFPLPIVEFNANPELSEQQNPGYN
jgi:hypothetical protein